MLLLLACALPLTEGTYQFAVASQENSCGWSDDDWGVGTAWEMDLSWPNSDTLWFEQDGGVIEYLYDGNDAFSGEGSVDQEIAAPCFLHFDILDEGIITKPTAFQVHEFVSVGVQGDCSSWDTSKLPCDAQLLLKGVLQDP